MAALEDLIKEMKQLQLSEDQVDALCKGIKRVITDVDERRRCSNTTLNHLLINMGDLLLDKNMTVRVISELKRLYEEMENILHEMELPDFADLIGDLRETAKASRVKEFKKLLSAKCNENDGQSTSFLSQKEWLTSALKEYGEQLL